MFLLTKSILLLKQNPPLPSSKTLLWVVTSDITKIGIDCINYYTDQRWPFKTDESKIKVFFQQSTIT